MVLFVLSLAALVFWIVSINLPEKADDDAEATNL